MYGNLGNIMFIYYGKYEAAIQYYHKARDLGLVNASLHYNCGNAYAGLGEFKDAIDEYNKAIRIDPEHYRSYDHRGRAKYELGDAEGYLEDARKAFDLKYPHLSHIHNYETE